MVHEIRLFCYESEGVRNKAIEYLWVITTQTNSYERWCYKDLDVGK